MKSWKITGNTTNFFDKLEKEVSDLVQCSTTFTVSQWNKILWVLGKKKFP